MKTTFKKWGRNWFCGGGVVDPARPACPARPDLGGEGGG